MGKFTTGARLAKATAKGKVQAAGLKAGKKAFDKPYGGPSKVTKAKGAAKSAGKSVGSRASGLEIGAKRSAGKAKRGVSNLNAKSKGTGRTPGAAPDLTKSRSKNVGSVNVSKSTYGKGRKRTTVVSGVKVGKSGMKGKTVAITPKGRTAAYGGAAGVGASAGGYTTYKRRTKSGKIVTVRRKSGRR